MAKMGRPKAEMPKTNKVTVRFTDEELALLKERAEKNNSTIAQTVREGVEDIIHPSK